jgi:hypothetical protein
VVAELTLQYEKKCCQPWEREAGRYRQQVPNETGKKRIIVSDCVRR